jgi:PQQ-like domain
VPTLVAILCSFLPLLFGKGPLVNAIKSLNRVIERLILACALVVGGSVRIANGQVAVTTHHNDNGRTGQNLTELVLNTSNVNVNTFGKLFSRAVDGQIYAQPLYVPHLAVAGQIRNVVYVATQNDTVYAFDADDPTASSPLWRVHFGTPVPSTDVDPACADITPQVGITSTPVIDTSSSTIYVVAKTKNTTDSRYHFNIHALDLITGTEKFGGPTEIAAQVPGTGVESVGGTITLDPLHEFGTGQRWNRSDDHGNGVPVGSDGKSGGNSCEQCGCGQRYIDHSDYSIPRSWVSERRGHQRRCPTRLSVQRLYLHCVA